MNSVGSTIQALVMNELSSVDIEGAVFVIEMSIMRPTGELSIKLKHWLHAACVLIEVLLLVRYNVHGVEWALKQKHGSRKNPQGAHIFKGWLLFSHSSCATCEAKLVSCVSTGNVGLAEKLARIYEIDYADVQHS